MKAITANGYWFLRIALASVLVCHRALKFLILEAFAQGNVGARELECQSVPESLPRLTNAAALAAASVRPLFLGARS